MTETENLINDLSKTHPNLKDKIAHYDEQLSYAFAIIDLRKELGLTQQLPVGRPAMVTLRSKTYKRLLMALINNW
ncbi:hypothetical protein B8W96_01935 [Lentilactobacillus parakefiri]|nr:hypothetical protein [Lentilactobacillus parakefiri]PAL01300.1 hypothetical protein B8W96_01935 [Lentilactobacillus parakefiri]